MYSGKEELQKKDYSHPIFKWLYDPEQTKEHPLQVNQKFVCPSLCPLQKMTEDRSIGLWKAR